MSRMLPPLVRRIPMDMPPLHLPPSMVEEQEEEEEKEEVLLQGTGTHVQEVPPPPAPTPNKSHVMTDLRQVMKHDPDVHYLMSLLCLIRDEQVRYEKSTVHELAFGTAAKFREFLHEIIQDGQQDMAQGHVPRTDYWVFAILVYFHTFVPARRSLDPCEQRFLEGPFAMFLGRWLMGQPLHGKPKYDFFDTAVSSADVKQTHVVAFVAQMRAAYTSTNRFAPALAYKPL